MPLFNFTAASQPTNSTAKFNFSSGQRNTMGAQLDPTTAPSSRQHAGSRVSTVFGSLSIKTPDELELEQHIALLGMSNDTSGAKIENNARLEEVRNAPLFTRGVKSALKNQVVDLGQRGIPNMDIFPQYGLIGHREAPESSLPGDSKFKADRDIIYANMNAPWSAFICGSQGAGKSHTFSCLLENALLSPNAGGVLPDPLTGIVFHYDKFTSHTSTQLCEAAFLCSIGIPVQVLVSPSNIHAMKKLYGDLPELPKNAPRPQVRALQFHENHLNVGNMKTLMNVDAGAANPPLYLAVLDKILRDMAKEREGRPGFDYRDFRNRLEDAGFTDMQLGPLKLRLQLLEEFLDQSKSASSYKNVFNQGKGTLTIVDLSCPFVDENDASALFSICLSLFLEQRSSGGRIIALDEAHKFLTQSGEAEGFTEQLISIIRQQRHLASRVVIATQEPTLSPQLLELCNVTFVHRFRSPKWLDALKHHIAGAANLKKTGEGSLEDLFESIVGLRTGEALVFSPDSLLDVRNASIGIWDTDVTLEPLLDKHIKLHIRSRISADGGKSIMASDKTELATPATGSEASSSVDSTDDSSEEEEAHLSSNLRVQPSRHVKQQATTLQRDRSAAHAHPARRPSPTPPLSSSVNSAKPQRKTVVKPADVVRALNRHTELQLNKTPNSLDFGGVRNNVRAELGLDNNFWEGDWMGESKSTIKQAAEAWSRENRKPLPGNCTWVKSS